MKNYIILFFIALASAAIYVLSILDKDEVINHNRRKGYIIRRSIIGAFGSAIAVWLSFEIAIFYGLPESFSLAISGFIGFLGADILSRFAERALNKLLDWKFGGSSDER